MLTKDDISSYLDAKGRTIAPRLKNIKIPENLYWCKTHSEAIHCLLYNISNEPKCFCGNPVNFYRLHTGYNNKCSRLCSNRNRKDRRKSVTFNEFVEISNKIHSNKYSYISLGEKIKIECPVHGEFEQNIHSHMNGSGCSKCNGGVAFSKDEWINKSSEVHKNKYNYSLIDFNQKTLNIICSIHGEFRQNKDYHINGSGCQECYNKKRSEISSKALRNKYNLGEYKNCFLYIIESKKLNCIKIGLTSIIIDRFNSIKNTFDQDSELIYYQYFNHASDWECYLHNKYDKYCKIQEKGNGRTEWFCSSIKENVILDIQKIITK